MRRINEGLTRILATMTLIAALVAVPGIALAIVGSPDWSTIGSAATTGTIDDQAVVGIGSVIFALLWAWFAIIALGEIGRIVAWRSSKHPITLAPTDSGPGGQIRKWVRMALISSTAVFGTGFAPASAGHALPLVAHSVSAHRLASEHRAGSDFESHQVDNVLRSTGRDTPYSVAVRLGDARLRDRIIALNNGSQTPVDGVWKGGVFPEGMLVTLPEGSLDGRAREWTTYTVVEGDSVYRIAAAMCATDSRRVREVADEIINRNLGSTMIDGTVFDDPSMVMVGWIIEVPSIPEAPTGDASAPRSTSSFTHTVEAGDSYWQIAERQLGVDGNHPTAPEIAAFTDDLVTHNAPLLGHDLSTLIVPGEIVRWDATNLEPVVVLTDPPSAEVAETVAEPVIAEPEPVIVETTFVEPTFVEPTFIEPTFIEPTSVEPTFIEPTFIEPTFIEEVTGAASGTPASGATAAAPTASSVNPDESGVPVNRSLGAAALLCAGALGLIESRRRHQLRRATTANQLEAPSARDVATERLLRSLDLTEHATRLDLALRSAGHHLVGTGGFVLGALTTAAGEIALILDRPGRSPEAPWTVDHSGSRWILDAATPTHDLVATARLAGQPCPAMVHIGTIVSDDNSPELDGNQRELFIDLEAFGLVAIDSTDASAVRDVLRAITTSLAASPIGETLRMVTHQLDTISHLGNLNAESADSIDQAIDRAAASLGSTPTAIGGRRTSELRSRGVGGEAWEPVVVASGASDHDPTALRDLVAITRGGGRGIAVVLAHAVEGASLTIRATAESWVIDCLGLTVIPVGLSMEHLVAVHDLLDAAERPLADVDVQSSGSVATDDVADDGPVVAGFVDDLEWDLMVTVLGTVSVQGRNGQLAQFERSKSLELTAWLALHRQHPTRTAARTALWELDVRDATFANVVSEARRALGAIEPCADGCDWIERTHTDQLPLNPRLVTDVDVVRHRVLAARILDHVAAIDVLQPAVELISGLPFAGTNYLWSNAEGITSELTLLATGAATELARHYLAVGDVEGVFWSTGRGLTVLAGHEELIGLRMRAHAQRGDMAGVRSEWEVYERALHADPWSSGEPSPKLVAIRYELLSR